MTTLIDEKSGFLKDGTQYNSYIQCDIFLLEAGLV
jgi:hypothetical protein